MAVLDANLSVPFAIANQNLRYVTTFHGQFTNDALTYIDDLTIGSRYTVRGFDGEGEGTTAVMEWLSAQVPMLKHTGSARSSANESKSISAGARRSDGSGRRSIAASGASTSTSS
jgi:hypothetical protein